MLTLNLRNDEITDIQKIAGKLAAQYSSVEDSEFHRESFTYAQDLPQRVRLALAEYRMSESDGIFLLSGLPVDDLAVGPTPADWRNKPDTDVRLRHDIAFFLLGCLLGEPVGWATQQDGRVMHDVLPMRGYEHDQIGLGSEELLAWHTEDAFHPLRADYLGLMCLRNHDGVETTVADIADVRLDEEVRKILAEPRFYILPDDSHRPVNGLETSSLDPRTVELQRRSSERVDLALDSPEPVAVLFGSPSDPYVRIDPHYMRAAHGDEEQKALDAVIAALYAAIGGVVLQPGDICFLDNFRVVHGRKPFRARFDGTDRWLRRLNIVRDLRKSREVRLDARSRIIY